MIQIEHLTVGFGKASPVVQDLTLTVPGGCRTVIVGESGSGKSVTLCAILRILPADARVSGSVTLTQTPLLKITEKEMRQLRGRSLAYIPQGSGASLNPLLTAGLQVAEPIMEFEKVPKKQALARAIIWMRQLQLGREQEVAACYPHTLSGGMKQRVLIAMGAAAGAQTLLADEPTKGLDKKRIEAVAALFEQLQGKTLLCVSHDLRFCRRIADYVCVMYAAQQVEYCTKEEFFTNPLHPYSQMMQAALPENGLNAAPGFAPPAKQAQGGCCFYSRCPYAGAKCKTPPPLVQLGQRKVRCHRYADSG